MGEKEEKQWKKEDKDKKGETTRAQEVSRERSPENLSGTKQRLAFHFVVSNKMKHFPN